MSNVLDWAENEIIIACKKENSNRNEEMFDYGRACYESALKAFQSLYDDGHSGLSIRMTKWVLDRLIDGKPLTPIEDTDDVWVRMLRTNEKVFYQCKRMRSLFKEVYADGTVKYSDNNRSCCVSVHDCNDTYSMPLVRKIIDEMFPMTMPYMPGKPIEVYCEVFLTDKKNGDFDTVGVFYAMKTEDGKQEKIEINRFFREPEDNEEGNWTEISKEEYYERKERWITAADILRKIKEAMEDDKL